MDPWLHVLHNVAASIERFRAFGLSRILFPKGVPPSPMYRWDFPWNHPAIKEYHHLWKVPYFQEKMENQGAMNWETLNHMIGKNHHDLVEYGVKMGWFYMYLWLFSSSSFSYGKIHGERGHIGRKSSIDGHIPEYLPMMLGTRPVPYSGLIWLSKFIRKTSLVKQPVKRHAGGPPSTCSFGSGTMWTSRRRYTGTTGTQPGTNGTMEAMAMAWHAMAQSKVRWFTQQNTVDLSIVFFGYVYQRVNPKTRHFDGTFQSMNFQRWSVDIRFLMGFPDLRKGFSKGYHWKSEANL